MSVALIRVVVIEDLREVREGLAMLINGTSGFECSGSFRTMEDALAGADVSQPDVILTDIGLPGMNGIDGTRILSARFPTTPPVLRIPATAQSPRPMRRVPAVARQAQHVASETGSA